MTPRSAAAWTLALVLLLAGCRERATRQGAPAPAEATFPSRSAPRPPREFDAPASGIVLREHFDRALRESDPAARDVRLEAVAWDALDVDPALSREAFAALTPDSASSRRLVGHFAMRLADESPEKAIAWARGLEREEERSDAFGRIAVVVSATAPARAAELVSVEMSAGSPRDRAVVQVLQRWVQAAPADAAAWIAGFPQGAARAAGLKTVAAAWIRSDAPALAAWVEAREEGPARSEAVLAFAGALRAEASEARGSLLGSFRDPATRKQLESILSQPPP
jgi:hypothetical protein